MDPGWIGALGGAASGIIVACGSFLVQRLNFNRSDGGVRRELGTKLELVLRQLYTKKGGVLLPQLRESIRELATCGYAEGVAVALSNRQHLAVIRAIDELRRLIIRIDGHLADAEHYRAIGAAPPEFWEPSEADYLGFDDYIRRVVDEAAAAVEDALRALKRTKPLAEALAIT